MVNTLTIFLDEGHLMNVLILAGSHRRDSWTVQVAQELPRLAPAGTSFTLYAGLEELPFYSQDLDVEDVASAPVLVTALREAIRRADALVVLTPEYNGSLPGVLKNAIDWASRPRGAAALDGLHAAVIGVSPSPRGAQWAAADAVKVLRVAGADVVDETTSIASVYRVLEAGRLVDSELEASLISVLAALADRVDASVSKEDAA